MELQQLFKFGGLGGSCCAHLIANATPGWLLCSCLKRLPTRSTGAFLCSHRNCFNLTGMPCLKVPLLPDACVQEFHLPDSHPVATGWEGYGACFNCGSRMGNVCGNWMDR
eukprot:1150967-Pelagomonas_calceolata.AAC.2